MIEQLFDVDVESEKNTDQVPSFLLMNCLPHLTFVAKVQDAYQILEELRDPTIYDASSEDSWAAEGSRELVKRSKACNAAMKTVCCNKTGPCEQIIMQKSTNSTWTSGPKKQNHVPSCPGEPSFCKGTQWGPNGGPRTFHR